MPIEFSTLLDAAGEHAHLVILVMAAGAMLEAAFGLGPFVPGETIVLAGSLTLDGAGLQAIAWPAVALGAFFGDHVGYLIGRRTGPALAGSAVVRRIGTDRWDRATDLVRRHGMATLVVARLLPGVRTLIAAAAGASGIGYRRFAIADALAASIWAGLWIFGGAALGQAIGKAFWIVVPLAVIGIGVVLVRRHRARRRVEHTEESRTDVAL